MVETPGGSDTSLVSGVGYKDKYLQVLEDQERSQKQFAFQLEVMRKTLNHLGVAANGLDKNLDAALLLLREKMRGAPGPHVIEQMEVVQKAVATFELSREKENTVAATKMRALLDEYLSLKLPADLRDKLRGFSKGTQQALSNYRAYPLVLGELILLQEAALHAAMNPSTSFFQRLRGGNTLKSAKSGQQLNEQARELKAVDEDGFQLAPDSNGKTEHNVAPSISSFSVATDSVKNRHLLDEEGYEKVAGRIALTLSELVENIEPNDVVRHKVDIVRLRIERGMDWFALSVTLEDIRDILMQRYLDVDREFSQYLQEVNKELHAIGESLGVALEHEAGALKAVHKLSNTVSDEVEKIHSTMATTDSVQNLKETVSSHLVVIQSALSEYREARDENESESLSKDLRKLLAKVESIESESNKTKELLEEERYRATHDALTGLPNREAYNERAFQELQRFQRYGRPLSMAVCDIDFFKKINDTYGHQAGDRVLKLIAKVVSTRLRKVDFVARYGGEEFVMILPETGPQHALKVLDKIRGAVASAAFRFKEAPVKITISFGITGFVSDDSVELAFARADKAMYQAKAKGRNCCVVAEHRETDA